MLRAPILETHIPELLLLYRGKVRDVYELPGDELLIVSTDRISAYDVIMQNGVAGKGCWLTQISLFWFNYLMEQIPGLKTHLVDDGLTVKVGLSPESYDQIKGRYMVVRKYQPLLVEAVARGYLEGSGLKDYKACLKRGEAPQVCGVELPTDLLRASKLPYPIFTPATKAEKGEKDENIPFSRMVEIVGDERVACQIQRLTMQIYEAGVERVESADLILADTKFEFALGPNNKLVLIDEALTMDSSRYWEQASYKPGRAQKSFDKQPVRDYLEGLEGWMANPVPIELPESVIKSTVDRYQSAVRIITGQEPIAV